MRQKSRAILAFFIPSSLPDCGARVAHAGEFLCPKFEWNRCYGIKTGAARTLTIFRRPG